jgi:hypothetical protein
VSSKPAISITLYTAGGQILRDADKVPFTMANTAMTLFESDKAWLPIATVTYEYGLAKVSYIDEVNHVDYAGSPPNIDVHCTTVGELKSVLQAHHELHSP